MHRISLLVSQIRLERAEVSGFHQAAPGALLFFAVQALLLAVYLPLALKHVHGFGWVRQIVVGLVPLVTMWLGILIYLETGAMGALSSLP
jgi:hypothetical protein